MGVVLGTILNNRRKKEERSFENLSFTQTPKFYIKVSYYTKAYIKHQNSIASASMTTTTWDKKEKKLWR